MDDETYNFLIEQAKRLRRRTRKPLFAPRKIPKGGGVYVIWKRRTREAAYVGESPNLFERENDLKRPASHTFTRQIQKKRGYRSAKRLQSYMKQYFEMSFLPLPIGRAELEDFLICYWNTTEFNDRPARYIRSEDCLFENDI